MRIPAPEVTRATNSRNGHLPVLYDSPRIADDDRRERLNMKRYGVWNFVILTDSGEMKRFEITARSGKDAKRRVEYQYKGCEVLKMSRVTWLSGFNYEQISLAMFSVDQKYGKALLTILADNGVFSAGENKPATVD